MKSLKSLKVIELASVLAGPAVGQFFVELGAEVIKVENEKAGGDVTRTWRSPGEDTDDRSAYFTSVNWGKKSVSIDLADVNGRKHLVELVRTADIIIASFKPGDAQKLGADYQTLRSINERIIYGEISGYGSGDGRVGYDAVIQAESGFMSLNGEADRAPLKMPVALIDVLAAHHLKEGLMIALWNRESTGQGQKVEVSLYDAAVSSLSNQAANFLVGKNLPRRQGSLHPNIAPYGETIVTKDNQQILLAIGNDKQFAGLLDILGISELVKDSRFITNEKRVANRSELHIALSKAASGLVASALMTEIHRKQIPAGLVATVGDAIQSKQSMSLMLASANIRGLRTLVARFDGRWCNPSSLSAPPHLGEHTGEVLGL